MTARVEAAAEVDPSAVLGAGTRVWQLAHIRENAVIGEDCIVGRGAYIGAGVRIGDNCKVQNYALVYEPAVLDSGVFVGPSAVLTNDQYPRAINSDGSRKLAHDWRPVGVDVGYGASIGAHAVCVAPVSIGRWAMVAAGAVVVDDVPDFALVVGSPARQIRWVGHAGLPLNSVAEGQWECPASGRRYNETEDSRLVPIDVGSVE